MSASNKTSSGTPSPFWHGQPFYLHIQVLFTVLILLTGGALLWSNYQQGKSVVLAAAEDLFERIQRESGSQMERLRAPMQAVVEWVSRAPITDATRLEARLQSLQSLAGVLERQPRLEAIYVGYYDGGFFLVRALRTDADRKRFDAPRHAAYLVQSIERGDAGKAVFMLFDAALNEIERGPPPAGYTYDPRTRPWYIAALKSTELIQTDPYMFFTTGHVGQTVARRAEHGRAIVGADVTLTQVSETLAQARPTPSSELAVITPDGSVVAYSDPARMTATAGGAKPALRKIGDLSPALGIAAADLPAFASRKTADAGGQTWHLRALPQAGDDGRTNAYLLVGVPDDELLSGARAVLQRSASLTLVLILLTMPLTWLIARRLASNLHALTREAAAIRRFDFAAPPALRTRIKEIAELGEAMKRMRETIRKFLDISRALSAERKVDRLISQVLEEAHAAAGATASVIYLLSDDGKALNAAAHTLADADVKPAPIEVSDKTNPVVQALAPNAAIESHQLPVPRPSSLAFVDAKLGAGPALLVTTPLLNRAGVAIGVLCLFIDSATETPSEARLALVEAFAGAGAVAIDNQRLLAAQKTLLDALIRLIAGAIDAKSPYTGGHCERVPELTFMLARAACETKHGPFASFDLDDDGWEALKIAAGLHDCGKVTTPEYVVDKATKLETLYDRIHEIRMRFEVLKRDARIRCLEAVAAGGDASKLKASLEAELRTLDEEFAFVAKCNTGGEFLAPEQIARLTRIATRTWQRTLDDRIGISWEEGLRKGRTPAPALPATERLLDDKPEHVLQRTSADVMAKDNPWGFKVDTPQFLYNRGELYNLSVSRGTLTDEERYKINDHIVQTIVMLSQLPLPPHLKSVPELAGGHHEKMDGTGYPKRLRREEMSVPARIMAIADIFEALTASDRPYKKGKMLSEAIKIMAAMKKDRHIDPDLFDLFLTSGIYREYAERFLEKRFIDEVDVKAYVASPAAAMAS